MKEVLIKAYNSVDKIERHYTFVRRIYKILETKIPNMNKEVLLQMAVKAINDLIRPKGLVLILLVFRVYIRISTKDLLITMIKQRKQAINKAIIKLKKLREQRQVFNTLNIRNKPNMNIILLLLLNSKVIIYHKNIRWTKPFKLFIIDSEIYTINILYETTKYKTTIITLYLRDSLNSFAITYICNLKPKNEDKENNLYNNDYKEDNEESKY